MRLKLALMIPFAAVLGFVAVQTGRHWIDRQVREGVRSAATNVASPAPEVKFGTIVVAAKPLRFGMELEPAALREIPWPQGQTPKGTYAKIADLFAEKGKRVVVAGMDDNEPILASKITGPGQRANLAAILDEGMKAVSVRVDDIVGVAGFVLPGDRVDVMLTRQREKGEAYNDIILQNLKILAIDQLVDERSTNPKVSRTVTLEVETQQAQRLVVAGNVGALTLILRPAGDNSQQVSQRVTATDLSSAVRAQPRKENPDEDAPVASMPAASAPSATVTVGVIRKAARQEYSVPTTRKD